jgi:hypothetical protein
MDVEGTAATVEKAAKESPWLDQQKNQSKRKKVTTNEIPERYQSEAMKWHVLAKICRRKSQLFPGGTPATSHSQPRRPDHNPFRKLQGTAAIRLAANIRSPYLSRLRPFR